jgi:mono/diheme cytochrome c family protein
MQFNARLFFGISAAISAVMLIIVGASWLTPRSTPDTLMAQGYAVWQANGCSGCHTLYGLGGVYAPDLTHIYAQRGDTYLREFLANPNAFHPDQRIMPRFHLNRTETDALIAFLASTSSADCRQRHGRTGWQHPQRAGRPV